MWNLEPFYPINFITSKCFLGPFAKNFPGSTNPSSSKRGTAGENNNPLSIKAPQESGLLNKPPYRMSPSLEGQERGA